jgi:hypothetical protein
VLNQTDIRVDVTVSPTIESVVTIPGVPAFTIIGLEPGSTARFDVAASPYQVIARPARPDRSPRVNPVGREYTALGMGDCSPRITVRKEPVGRNISILTLSDAEVCGPDDPPGDDPGLPPAAAVPRESLLALLSSSGLLALAVVGLLINRHE